MDRTEHEYYINWIIANSIHFKFNNKSYFIKSPSLDAKFKAQEIFFDYYYKAKDSGVLETSDIYKLLDSLGIWNKNKETILKNLTEELDQLKINVFQNYLNTPTRKKAKQAIKDTKDYINSLLREKSTFLENTAEGLASYAKQQFLLGSSIYNSKGKPYWRTFNCWEMSDCILNVASQKLTKFSLSEEHYRELAKSDSWRGLWSSRKGSSIFGKPLVKLSDPQRYLIFWSLLYDNVYSSSECPADEMVDDDDALDGWLLLQRKKRKNALNKSMADEIMNDKIRNSEHVFILTGEEDVEKVYELNDVGGKIALNQRLSQIKRDGMVEEANLIDTRRQIQMKMAHIQ